MGIAALTRRMGLNEVKPIVLLRQSPRGDGFRCALPILQIFVQLILRAGSECGSLKSPVARRLRAPDGSGLERRPGQNFQLRPARSLLILVVIFSLPPANAPVTVAVP